MAIRILVADDHGVLRAGLRALLNAEPNLEVVGEAVDGYEALQLARQLCPDILLLDITMQGPEGGSIEIARTLKQTLPQVRVLFLTLHEDVGLLREALQAGAAGYTIKRTVDTELINAIHAVYEGNYYVHPEMTQALLKDMIPASSASKAPAMTLTHRELDVLRLIVKGYTNRRIAQELCVSMGTVNSHRANIMSKLNLHNRVELVRYASEHKLLD
jgi:DNA-binding NarL/FixJ family response regulator